MDVAVEHFVDAGEHDSAGHWDFNYEGDSFHFRQGPTELHARVYVEQPGHAHFLASPAQCDSTGLLVDAVAYLRVRGVTQFLALGPSGGYEPLTIAGGPSSCGRA